MRTVEFEVAFHSEFRVGATYGRDGVDLAVEHDDPLPAEHLKGLMRAAAQRLFKPGEVERVFGSVRRRSPWSWTSAEPTAQPTGEVSWRFGHRHRVSIHPETHAARRDHLVLAEWVYTPTARFEVVQTSHVDPAELDGHCRLLRVSAAGVHAIGGWRRRGLGWVGITPVGQPITAGDVAHVLGGRTPNA
jgi:hypothetical protein